jgi:hypothetical protein
MKNCLKMIYYRDWILLFIWSNSIAYSYCIQANIFWASTSQHHSCPPWVLLRSFMTAASSRHCHWHGWHSQQVSWGDLIQPRAIASRSPSHFDKACYAEKSNTWHTRLPRPWLCTSTFVGVQSQAHSCDVMRIVIPNGPIFEKSQFHIDKTAMSASCPDVD